jgi:hypothetical protein
MDPFATPTRKHRGGGVELFHKTEVVAFIQSLSFEYIELPTEMRTSTNENLTSSFFQIFCEALANSLAKSAPQKSTPKKLFEQISLFQADTPTKGATKSAKPEPPIISKELREKIARVPEVFPGIPTSKKTTSRIPLLFIKS